MKGSVPLYHHVKNEILHDIQEGRWPPDAPIPSEAEISQQFHVSRTTVRQAIGDLVSMGFLVRQQGRGTFVAKRHHTAAVSPLYGFAEELRQRHNNVHVVVESISFEACPPPIAKRLEMGSELAVRISRTAHADNTCVFHETSYLRVPFHVDATQLVQTPDAFDYVYGFFEENGVRIGLGKQWIRAELATAHDVAILGVDSADPILVVERITQDIAGVPVEHSEVRYSSRLYEFQINLHRQM
ncbi:GntR family transcriptional regulator [Alicyclobacillus tolerans]|uniref:GntR family transcriptional regulator n=1 Tax=Alicyclobacillus tolerans TaxID=90970 RepID=UPI001F1EF609|nr:GntR family transcriptional regulator [Alicyclobacillus tolerans]MCF8566094.1 GntR family transcriptional regulator [Alicyclobacillus tolerans]